MFTTHPLMKSSTVFNQFKECTQQQYDGRLEIKSSDGQKWSFYYRLGQLFWATGGIHPYRRLRRLIAQNCPQQDINQLHLTSEHILIGYWDYRLLETLYGKQQISQKQFNAIVENTISELLFDLAQQTSFASLSWHLHPEVLIDAPISLMSANMSLQQMQDSWDKWSEAGLASFSQNLAPVVRQPELLKQQISPSIYKNFEKLINGKYTLLDLAVKMKQSILALTRSLLPYVRKGIVEFVEVDDLPLPITQINQNHQPIQIKKRYAPLIACVDDSPQVCKILEKIIGSNGLMFIDIQDPIQALPILIQSKPDLIFLDLMMPIVNGYELCAQLRRSSVFANIPIVILTASDKLFDQVRSKVYGATDFLTKPVETDKVMGVINKHFPKTASTPNNIYEFALSY